jgi:hypothetical protein
MARRLAVSGFLARMCGCRILPWMISEGMAVKDIWGLVSFDLLKQFKKTNI